MMNISHKCHLVCICVVSTVLCSLADAAILNSRLDKIHRDYQELQNNGNYPAALEVATSMVRVAADAFGSDAPEMATHLQHLAIVQSALEDYISAEMNLRKGIGILEDNLGSYDPSLITPLIRLGRIDFETRKYATAMGSFRRAQHILHRTYGVQSIRQLDIVDWITSVDLALNRFSEADKQQRFAFWINNKSVGKSSSEIIPAMASIGEWFRTTGQYHDALGIYKEMISIVEKNQRPELSLMLQPLDSIAAILFTEGICCPANYLEQHHDIIRENPNRDFLEEISSLILLADFELLSGHEKRAKKLYAQSWSLLSSQQDLSPMGQFQFSAPKQLAVRRVSDIVSAYRRAQRTQDWTYQQSPTGGYFDHKPFDLQPFGLQPFGLYELRGNPLPMCSSIIRALDKTIGGINLDAYYVDLVFSVNSNGETYDAIVTASNSPRSLQQYTLNLLEYTRFRPRISEGQTASTEKIKVRQEFTAYQKTSSALSQSFDVASMVAERSCGILSGQTRQTP